MKIAKLRKAPNGQPCIRCGRHIEGGVFLCHYTGWRQHSYGKGMGIKGHDAIGAHLCTPCHDYFDKETVHKGVDKSEEFLHYIALTIIRLFNMGVLKV